MKFSIVIPAYNEEKCIGECLDAILQGSELPEEIIVADGRSKDHTRQIAASRERVKVLDNPKGHAAGGRNVGIKAAKGDVIVFIDADCIPDRDWLREIRKAFEEDDIDGLGTYIEPAPAANEYEEFWGKLSLQILMSYGHEPYYVTEKTLNQAFITASCAYKKKLLCKIKGFNNFFANNAEDIDICWRALDAGARLKYVPTAKISAHSPQDLSGIKRKSFRNGVSSSKLQKVYSDSKINFDKNLYKALFQNIKGILKGEKYAGLFLVELIWHLAGKYYGSFKYGVINF